MPHTRTSSTLLLGFYMLVVLLAGAVILAAAAAAQAEDATLVPVAPPEGVELAYDIPLQPWLVPTVLGLKTQFADGLTAEFNGIAENQTGEELTTMTLAPTSRAVFTAPEANASVSVSSAVFAPARVPAEDSSRGRARAYSSAVPIILLIIATVSTGYFPVAVSAEE